MNRLANPVEAVIVAALAVGGAASPWSAAAAAVLFAGFEIAAGVRRAEGPRWIPSRWPRGGSILTILYDATCVLCVGSKTRLETWRTADRLRFVALQAPEARALVPDLPEERFRGAMHVVEEGRVFSAEEGWYRIMRLGPLEFALAAAILPRFLARPLYAWVARHRLRWFGTVCDGGACRIR